MELQLTMFADYPPVNVLPPMSEVIALPVAPVWCEECYEVTNLVPLSSPHLGWMCEYETECSCCYEHSHNICSNCGNVEDCCSCSWCQTCSEPVDSSDFCNECDSCPDHCECVACTNCDRRYPSDDYMVCSECERCERCGCECDEDECSCDDCHESNRTTSVPSGIGKHLVGIEIEFGGSMHTAAQAIAAAGLHDWAVKYDGSVSRGGELASPPLDWDLDSSREELHTAIDALKRAGCTTDVAAGVHVHVDARDLSPRALASVAIWGHDWEDVLYRIASSGWETIRSGALASYAKPITADFAKQLESVESSHGLERLLYSESRYQAVNLMAYEAHGTIEFRVFNSSLSASRISAYVGLCVAVVQSAREGKTPKPATRYYLGGMASGNLCPVACFDSLKSSLGRYLSAPTLYGLAAAWEDSKPQAA